MNETTKYDIFIAYADDDAEWVEGFLMPSLGVPPDRIITRERFRAGVDKIKEFERAVTSSRYTLPIFSPAFLADVWTMFGESIASYFKVTQQSDRLLPLIRKPCTLPPHLGSLIPLDCTDEACCQHEIARLRELLQQPEPTLKPTPCPYPGMVPFSEANSDCFFGRDREIEELLQRLRLHPFITVIGSSGSGKSSLVFAGLISALRRSGLFGSEEWLMRTIRPGETPLTALKNVLGMQNLDFAVGESEAEPTTERLLLVVDQFEEVFTFGGQQAIPFQQALQQLIETPQCFMVLTVRADFYPDLMTCPLWEQIQSHRMEVLPLNAEGLREAIVKPAENVGVFVETALVERLIADAAGEPGVLPFIQETLVLLWERIKQRFLPLSAYEALGDTELTGLQVAIARRADAALAELNNRQQTIARRIFLRLIQFGEGRPDTRRQQTISDLRSADDNHTEFDGTLEYLVSKRLLAHGGKEGAEETNVDIAHEALIEGWPTLQTWIRERRRAEQTRRRLETRATDWERLERKGGVLDEVELHEAEEWLKSVDATELGYSKSLPELVEVSRKTIESELQKAKETARKLRFRLAIAGLLAIVAVLAAIIAVWGFNRANEKTRLAQEQTELAQKNEKLARKQEHLAQQEREKAQLNAIETLNQASKALFLAHDELGALLTSIKAGITLKKMNASIKLYYHLKIAIVKIEPVFFHCETNIFQNFTMFSQHRSDL